MGDKIINNDNGKLIIEGNISLLIDPSQKWIDKHQTPEYEPDQPTMEEKLEALEQENLLLKAQNKALAERTDFHEDLIAEMAMMIYS